MAIEKEQNNINNIISIDYLTPGNSEFTITRNGFLQIKTTVKNPEKDNVAEEIFFERVMLHRAFPFQNPFKYISVLGQFPKKPEEKKEEPKKDEAKPEETVVNSEETGEQAAEAKKEESPPKEVKKEENDVTSLGDFKEIGIISDIEDFSPDIAEFIKVSLDKKYFMPVILKINSIKEKYGYSYWVIETNAGKIQFTVHDTFRSIIKVTSDRIIINDINGNRYEIPSLERFDFNSMKKIELFL